MVDKKDIDLYIKMEQRHAKDVENAYRLGKLDILEKLKSEIDNIEEPDNDFEGFYYFYYCRNEVLEIIDKNISELKGE